MDTLIKEKIAIAPELLKQCHVQEEKQVVVHCTAKGIPHLSSIRVWPTIYIIPRGSNHRSKLLHHFNIVLYPNWQLIGSSGNHRFTLIFEGLPADCKTFDILEIIPESCAFEARNIARNESDVYEVAFF